MLIQNGFKGLWAYPPPSERPPMLRIGGQMLRICRLSGGGGWPKGWAELIWALWAHINVVSTRIHSPLASELGWKQLGPAANPLAAEATFGVSAASSGGRGIAWPCAASAAHCVAAARHCVDSPPPEAAILSCWPCRRTVCHRRTATLRGAAQLYELWPSVAGASGLVSLV